MRAERACNLWGVDYIHKVGADGLIEMDASGNSARQPDLEQCLGRAMFRLVPSGWFDQNKLSIARNHERYVFPAVDQERRIVSPAAAKQLASAMAPQDWRIYDLFSRLLMPALGNCASKFARAQSFCGPGPGRVCAGALPAGQRPVPRRP